MPTVSVNMMVRNEPFAVFALASVAQFADEILIYDTGSDDGTYENLVKFSKECLSDKNIKILRKNLGDAHGWTNKASDGGVCINMPPELSKAIGDTRREMQSVSKGDFIWILDGDEVYPLVTAQACRNLIDCDLQGKDCAFLWFIDILNSREIRHIHLMGRLFRNNAVEVKGNYPYEMHHSKNTGLTLEQKDGIVIPNGTWPVAHYESVVKPWRKDHHVAATMDEPYLPEVFTYFPDWFEKLKKFNIL
jgi:glycosyltransferase involved in cell wall biosynthesis